MTGAWHRGLGGSRVSLGLVDQSISSLTNLSASLAAARALTAEHFGAFSLVFLAYVLWLGAVRAVVSEPLTVQGSRRPHAGQHYDLRVACGIAVASAVPISFLALISAPLLPNTFRQLVIVLAVVMPGLLLQDTFRFVLFMRSKSFGAVINDGVWLLCVALTLVLFRSQLTAPSRVLLAWGLGANVAAVVAMVQTGEVPTWRGSVSWLRDHRGLSSRFLGEFLAAQGSGQLTLYLVGIHAGVGELAALRGAHVIYGPFHVASTSVQRLMIPDLVRLRERSVLMFRRSLELQTILMLGLALLIGLALVMIPDSLGTQLLGETWARARSVVIPVGLHKAGVGAAVGAFCGLRVLAAAREGLRARTMTAVLTVVGGGLGAWTSGALGAAWGMAAAQAVGVVLYWQAFIASGGAGPSVRVRKMHA